MAFQKDDKPHKRFEYDLSNPEHRELIKQFESAFEASGFKDLGSFNFWLRQIGIIKFHKDDWKNYAIKNMTKYHEYQQKWSALHELRRRRTFEKLQQMTPEERAEFDRQYDEQMAEVRAKIKSIKEKITADPQPTPEPEPDSQSVLEPEPESVADEILF